MSYRGFLAEFQQLGLAENIYIGQAELLNELNKLIKRRGIPASFNHEIHKELWEQCSKNADEQVLLSQYIKTIVDAKDILEDRLQQTEAKLTTSMEERKAIERELAVAKTSGEDRRVNELNDRLNRLDKVIFDADGDFKDFDSDLKNLLMPFAKDEASYRQSAVIAEPLIQQGYQSMSVNNPRTDVSMRTHSQIFFRRSSKTLTMLFLLSMAYLLLELLLMTHKNHFYSILCALALLAIFGLNYFDKLYIKFVIVLLLLGIVLDFFWLIFKGGDLWSPGKFGHDSRLNSAWYKLVVLMLVGEMFLKLIIALILLSYRNNKDVESMNIFGYSVVLSSDSAGNIITNYLETVFR